MSPFLKALHLAFALSLALLLVSRWERFAFPDLPDILSQTFADPLQTPTENIPLNPERRDGKFDYDVQPLFDYQLTGLVVSYHHSDHDIGMADHAAWNDYLNTADLCVIWGDNLKSKIYQKMRFSNDDWSCQASFKGGTTRQDWDQFQMTQFSNNHLLSGNLNVESTIAAIRPGDQIRLKGKLVKYKIKDSPGAYRTSSIVRTDTGNGACEIIYVTSAEILQPGHMLWRILDGLTKILVIGLGSVLAAYYLRIVDIFKEALSQNPSSNGP